MYRTSQNCEPPSNVSIRAYWEAQKYKRKRQKRYSKNGDGKLSQFHESN